MATVLYASVEDAKAAMDAKTNRSDAFVLGRLAAASDGVEGELRRAFYPVHGTRTWRLGGQCAVWLEADELISVETVTLDGTVLDLGDVVLSRPQTGDPYNRIELPEAGDELIVTGVFGYRLDERQVAAAVSVVGGTVTVDDCSAIGTGALLRIGAERMIVTRRGWTDSGNTLPVTLARAASATALALDAPVHAGETLLIGAERILVVDVAGPTVVVERAVDGSVLAEHTAVADVYVQRALQVDRAVLGTDEGSHAPSAPVWLFVYPPLVVELCLAEALVGIHQARSGYARTVGTGDNEQEASGRGLREVRARAIKAHRRPERAVIA